MQHHPEYSPIVVLVIRECIQPVGSQRRRTDPALQREWTVRHSPSSSGKTKDASGRNQVCSRFPEISIPIARKPTQRASFPGGRVDEVSPRTCTTF